MSSRSLFVSFAALMSASCAVAGVPSGPTVFYTVDSAVWTTYSTNAGASISTENFSNTSSGFYGSGVSGAVGGISWTATANNGGVSSTVGAISTSTSSATLNFAINPGVNGIAGNIYATNALGVAVSSIIMVTLSDSTTYVGYSNGPADFIGFYSSNLLISSLSIQASGETVTYATIDNLYFASVPAPGAIALIGLAGFAARRRERRA